MALKAWLKNGKLLVDSTGAPILCETCPCQQCIKCNGCCYAIGGPNGPALMTIRLSNITIIGSFFPEPNCTVIPDPDNTCDTPDVVATFVVDGTCTWTQTNGDGGNQGSVTQIGTQFNATIYANGSLYEVRIVKTNCCGGNALVPLSCGYGFAFVECAPLDGHSSAVITCDVSLVVSNNHCCAKDGTLTGCTGAAAVLCDGTCDEDPLP